MLSDMEREVFEDLREVETTHDLFKAIEKLENMPRTPQRELLLNAAGHMMGEALINYTGDKENDK